MTSQRPLEKSTFLSFDVLIYIVEVVAVDPENASQVAHAPDHIITQTLLSLCLLCRATYPSASRLLHTRCLYISSFTKLARLLESLSPDAISSPSPHIPHLHNLFLAPFPDLLDDLPIAVKTAQLLTLLGPSLRRLVIDMPLRTLYPEDDHDGVRPILRDTFIQLHNLEEFVSTRDELYLDIRDRRGSSTQDSYPWASWPQLRRLALYNADVSSDTGFWPALFEMRELTSLVLTRADGLTECDIRRSWIEWVTSSEAIKVGERERRVRKRTPCLTIQLVNVEGCQYPWPLGIVEADNSDQVKQLGFLIRESSLPCSDYEHDDIIDMCQTWVCRMALIGKLWEEGHDKFTAAASST
jgi:hypothetical protein